MLTGLQLARIQLRRGWRKLAVIALLIGLAGGLVLASAAGSARTFSAVDRMIEDTEPHHVLAVPDAGSGSELEFDAVTALPMVTDASQINGVFLLPAGEVASLAELDSGPAAMSSDGGGLYRFDRVNVTQGRMPDITSTDGLLVDTNHAEAEGIEIGDQFTWRIPVQDEIMQVFTAPSEEAALEIVNNPSYGTTVTLTVEGIGTTVEGVAVDEGFEPIEMFLPPALYTEFGEPSAGWGGILVRLDSEDSILAFRTAVNAMVPGELIAYQTLPENEAKAERATAPGAMALLVFAVVVAVIGLVLITQAFSRRFQFDTRDVDTLAVLGTTRSERFVGALARIGITTVAGVTAAVGFAWLLSPLSPVGPARRAEPAPGFQFDPLILLGGGAVMVAIVVIAAALPAWRWSRRGARRAATRRSVVGAWMASAGAGVPLSTGVRFGLEPGRGRTAVPTRATIAGAATAVAVIVAIVVFAASLDRVVEDPRFYGSNYDVAIGFEFADEESELLQDREQVLERILSDPAVESADQLLITEVVVDDLPVTSFALWGGPDGVQPTIAAGRPPAAVDQIALGDDTMKRLGVSLGDDVILTADGYEGSAVVVGRAVLPGLGLYTGHDRTALGTGGVVAAEALGPPGTASAGFYVARLRPGTSVDDLEERLSIALVPLGHGSPDISEVAQPADIQSLARLRSLPLLLAGVLVALVAATVVHAMVVAVRTRRRDLAVIQGLGATGHQIRMIGVWQGVTVGSAALVFGIPLGVIAGRWFWVILAEAFGTIAEPVVPLVALILLVPAVILSAAALGLVPVQRSLGRQPAEVLQSE